MPSPIRSACAQRSQRLSPNLALLAGAIDQVDGVNHDGLERRVRHRLPKRFEVLVGVCGRPPHPWALMEDLDRVAIALDPALDGVYQPTCCGNMRADQHDEYSRATSPSLRPLAHGGTSHRRRPDGTLQLASRQAVGRHARAADRGHRPGALGARERRADPGRSAMARARVGRRPTEPVRAPGASPRAGGGTGRRRSRIPRSGHSRGCAVLEGGPRRRWLPGGAPRRARRGGSPARPRRGGDRGRGSDPRAGAVREPDPGRLRDRARRRHPALQPRGCRRRCRHGDHGRGSRRRPPIEHAEAVARPERPRRCRAAIRAPAASARAGRAQAVEAARRRLGSGVAPAAGTCRPRFATTSRCWVGGPRTTRRSSTPRS